MLPQRFFLHGKDGEAIEAEHFGKVWRIWEYQSDRLQDSLEIPDGEIQEFVLYWQDNGYPMLQTA